MKTKDSNKPKINKSLNLSEQVMEKITKEQIQVEPKWHFVLAGFFTTFGLVSLLILTAYLLSLSWYLLKMHSSLYYLWFGFRGSSAFRETFPMMYLLLAVVSLVAGMWLLRRYDIAYKMKREYWFLGLILGMLVAVVGMDTMGLNKRLSKQRAVKALYMQYKDHQAWYKGEVGKVERRKMMVQPMEQRQSVVVEWNDYTRLPLGGEFTQGEWVIMVGSWQGEVFVAEGISEVKKP